MRTLLSIVFLSLSFLTFAQSEMLKIYFAPAFMPRSQLAITKSDTGYTMSIKGETVNETVVIQESSLSKLRNFMPVYAIEKQREDSIALAKKQEDEKNGIHIVGLDGITVDVIFRDQRSDHKFNFWSPDKASVNIKLMVLVFDLMNEAFVKPETKKYINGLKGYFKLSKAAR